MILSSLEPRKILSESVNAGVVTTTSHTGRQQRATAPPYAQRADPLPLDRISHTLGRESEIEHEFSRARSLGASS